MGGHNVQRILMSGLPDPSFILMNYGPYFSSFQAGDYHVYPDGRILMSGLHFLSDTVRGFTGGHCLVWFSNEGYLDTTAHHRTCSGSLDVFQELPDGRFIGSLGSPPNTATYDGQTTGSNIIRFHADGALDTTFQANAWWGGAYGFLPMEDGRVYAAGLFRIDGIEDTLHLVRFMPDGSLDPSFNNLIKFRVLEITSPYGAVPSRIYEYDDDHLIVLGGFELVAGSPRRGICMINTTGQLVEDLFEDAGCDNYNYNDFIHGSIAGMLPSSDGQWYIWGAYHGYDDGTINDPQQRFISRLYGPNVGVNEREEKSEIKIFPNPGDNEIMIDFQDVVSWPIEMKMYSQLGELVLARTLKQPQARVNTRKLASGMYSIQLEQKEKRIGSVKWVKE